MFALKVRLRGRHGLQIGSPGTANRLEATCNVYPTIELFGFEQTVVSGVEVFAFDVQAGEGEALAGSLFVLFGTGADFAQALSQLDGAAAPFQGGAETLYGPIRGLVFHEELGVEQSRFDVVDVFRW